MTPSLKRLRATQGFWLLKYAADCQDAILREFRAISISSQRVGWTRLSALVESQEAKSRPITLADSCTSCHYLWWSDRLADLDHKAIASRNKSVPIEEPTSRIRGDAPWREYSITGETANSTKFSPSLDLLSNDDELLWCCSSQSVHVVVSKISQALERSKLWEQDRVACSFACLSFSFAFALDRWWLEHG